MSEDNKSHNVLPLCGIRSSICFFQYVFRLVKFIWPIFSSLLIVIMLLGILIGLTEGWSIGTSLYFAFITGFTIGYGDITPQYPMTRLLSILLSAVGFLFTGILVAIAVQALHFTLKDEKSIGKDK